MIIYTTLLSNNEYASLNVVRESLGHGDNPAWLSFGGQGCTPNLQDWGSGTILGYSPRNSNLDYIESGYGSGCGRGAGCFLNGY